MLRAVPGLAALALAAGLGCNGLERRDPAAPAAALVLTAADGTRFSGASLAIQVAQGAEPPVQISLAAGSPDGQRVTLLAGAEVEALERGVVAVALGRQPLRAGVGVLTRQREGTEAIVSAGRLELRLGAAGRVEGRVGELTLAGRHSVTCWVRPESLGLPSSGAGSAGVVARVEDSEFRSPFCRRVAGLR